jgi:alpha-ketoglutarate-dependent taurine dioxygenase
MLAGTPIANFRWHSRNLIAQTTQWIFPIHHDLIRYVTQFNSTLDCGSEDLLRFRQVPAFREFSARLKRVVLREVGIALLKCGPDLTPDQARFVQLALGLEFGENITTTPDDDDRPLFALEVKDDPTGNGRYHGSGLKNDRIGFHTDGSGNPNRDVLLVSMLCIRAARFGGQSRLANSVIAYESLPEVARSLLHKSYARIDPNDPQRSLDSLLNRPIFKKEIFEFSYHPSFLRQGIEKTKGRIDHKEQQAFEALEKSLEDAAVDLNLMPNEILFINNRVIAHDRREFWNETDSQRLLERLWAGTYRS